MRNVCLIVALIVVLPFSAFSQSPQLSPQKFAELGDFRLVSGEIIRDLRIGYRTYGTLNEQKSNAVLFPTWFSGTTASLENHVGDGKLIDPGKFFVITVDAIGNGVSSSPSNSKQQPGLKFPKFTIRDMVNSQQRLVTEVLKIPRLKAVMGISMGGMQTYQWLLSYPLLVENAVPIVGTPQLTPFDLMLWNAELLAIENDRDYQNGSYTTQPELRTLAAIHELALTTQDHRNRTITRAGFAHYFAEAQKKRSFDANDWVRQLQAMMAHDVAAQFDGRLARAAVEVKARMLTIVATRDLMVNPGPAIEFSKILRGKILESTADCGHLIFECDGPMVNAAVARFLE